MNKMKKSRAIKKNLKQIYALAEKNVKLQLRFKFGLIIFIVSPMISILMPLIVFGQFLEYNTQFGIWNSSNFLVYSLIAYNIYLLRINIDHFPNRFVEEKYWQTFQAIMVAPFNRFNMLFGIFLTNIILISIPFAFFIILCWIYYPISFLTILFVLAVYFLISLIFSGIGLILGVFALSNENMWKLTSFILSIIIWLSCITYPFEIFPDLLQNVINLNPLYYILDFLRMSWIENNVIVSISQHSFSFSILIISSILMPCLGVYIFNLVYKKFGIVGY